MLTARFRQKTASLAILLIVLAALLVRVWGLGWDHLYPRHHDEQIHLRTAIKFSQGELSPRDIWLHTRKPQYVLYPWFSMYIVAGVINLNSIAVDLWKQILAAPGVLTFRPGGLAPDQQALLLGRLTIAIMGALTVWLLYLIGSSLWNRRVGFLSAVLLTFTGYHVANCHWLKNDISTLFFMTLALWFITGLLLNGKWRYYILTSIAGGIAIDCKFNVIPIVLVLVAAHSLRGGGKIKNIVFGLFQPRLLVAFLVLLITLVAAFPVAYLDFGFFRTHIISYLFRMPSAYLLQPGKQLSFFQVRYFNIINFFRFSFMMEHGMGIWLTLLGLAGMILAFVRRERRMLLVAAFPVIYLVVAILVASPGIRLQDTIPLYPYAALLSAIFVDVISQKLMKKKWLANGCFWLIGIVLLVPYVKTTLRMDYGYWQPAIAAFGTTWASKNIPSGSLVAREKKTLDLVGDRFLVATKRRLCTAPVQAYKKQGFNYLVTSSRQENRMIDKYGLYGPDHPFGRFYLSIESEYSLLKTFDLGEIPYKGGTVKIYESKESRPLCQGGLDSGLLRHLQHDFSLSAPLILFLNKKGQCEGNTNFLVPPETKADRLLISPVSLSEIGIQVVNGAREGTVRITVSGKKIKSRLQPHETRQFIFPARSSFPFIKKSYRVRISSAWNSSCLVRILPDNFRIGLGYWEMGEWEKAIKYLTSAQRDNPGDWYIYWLLTRAYQQTKQLKKAQKSSTAAEKLIPSFSKVVSTLREKVDFKRYTGYDPVWLEKRARWSWNTKDQTLRKMKQFYTTPEFIIPPGRFILECILPDNPGRPEKTLFTTTLLKNSRIVFKKDIKLEDIVSGKARFSFMNNEKKNLYQIQIKPIYLSSDSTFQVYLHPSVIDWLNTCLRTLPSL